MNTAVINIKTEETTKKMAQKIAREIGVSLSSLINAYLKHFIKTKSVTFSARDEEIPNAYFKRTLEKARKNWKEGKGSPVFDNVNDELKWLREQGI